MSHPAKTLNVLIRKGDVLIFQDGDKGIAQMKPNLSKVMGWRVYTEFQVEGVGSSQLPASIGLITQVWRNDKQIWPIQHVQMSF